MWDKIFIAKAGFYEAILKTYNGMIERWYDRIRNEDLENDQLPQHAIRLSTILLGKIDMPQSKEFEGLQNVENSSRETSIHGRKQKGKGINADEKIIPYDSNRLVLKNKVNKSDYINASWITKRVQEGSYDLLRLSQYTPFEEISFIVSQAPTPPTLQAYFGMINQEGVDIVVCFKKQMNKVRETVGTAYRIRGNIVKKIISDDKIRNDLYKQKVGVLIPSSSSRRIHRYTEFQCIAPSSLQSERSIKSFLMIFCNVRDETKKKQEFMKILTFDKQCGNGLSAVFIVLYEILEEIDKALLLIEEKKFDRKDNEKLVNIHSVVSEMRNKRMNSIKDFDHYSFIFKCMNYYVSHKSEFDKIVAMPTKSSKDIQTNELVERDDDVTYFLPGNNPVDTIEDEYVI